MEYLIFSLVLAAAALFMFFSAQFTGKESAISSDTELETVKGQIESVKNSLRDLELENSIGKISGTNYTLLKTEMLEEWQKLEEKCELLAGNSANTKSQLEPVAQGKCHACGAVLLSAAAKFCHICGAKVSQTVLVIVFLFALVLFPGAKGLQAYTINVTATNGTKANGQVIGEVSVIELKGGMNAIRKAKLISGKAQIANLPEPKGSPYMVQLDYQGVNYSKVIPPNQPSPVSAALEVFETTSTFSEKITARSLLEIHYAEPGLLRGIILLYFMNETPYTYQNSEKGVYAKVPTGAEIEAASVSVGSGSSDIQWLKLLASNSKAKAGFTLLPYAIKPGERIFQIHFKMPYKDKKAIVDFMSAYNQETPVQMIVEPEDLALKMISPPDMPLAKREDPTLKKKVYELGKDTRLYKFEISGGTPMPPRSNQNPETEQAQVVIASPLTVVKKIAFAFVAFSAFVSLIWLRKRFT